MFLELFLWGSWSRNLPGRAEMGRGRCGDPWRDTWSLQGCELFGVPHKVQPGLEGLEGFAMS